MKRFNFVLCHKHPVCIFYVYNKVTKNILTFNYYFVYCFFFCFCVFFYLFDAFALILVNFCLNRGKAFSSMQNGNSSRYFSQGSPSRLFGEKEKKHFLMQQEKINKSKPELSESLKVM